MKKLLAISLAGILSVAALVPTIANYDGVQRQNIAMAATMGENTVERQLELLHELQTMLYAEETPMVVPSSYDGTPIEIPNINMILPPTEVEEKIIIGVEFEIGDLGYEDFDEISELIYGQTPPQEVVDFILDFAGIPAENAEFVYFVFLPTPPAPIDTPLPEVCPVWGDYVGEEIFEVDLFDPYVTLNRTMRMGDRISIDGLGSMTAGHPFSASGVLFATSAHTTAAANRNVFVPNVPARVGVVMGSTVNPSVDVAWIDASVSGSHMSTQLPNGNTIRNFRGIPLQDDQVMSIRGFSGTHHSTISNTNGNIGGHTNKILTQPNGNSQAGDSGAALIRTRDNAVLGTRMGHGTDSAGRGVGIYSNVQRY